MHHDIWKITVLLTVAGLLGFVLNHLTLALLVMALGIIAWQIHRFNRLYKWVINPAKETLDDSSGQVYQLHTEIHRNNQKYKNRKAQLSLYLKQFRKAIGALPDAIILINDAGKIEWANGNAKAVLGINWPGDANVGFEDLVRHSDVMKMLASDTPSLQGIEISSHLDKDLTINIKSVKYTEELRMVIARDVSRLVKVNKMHSDFVANVSHELKTPLTVLRGYLEILQDSKELPELFKKPFKQMNLQSVRMQFIVNDLLYLSKLEDNENVVEHKSIDLVQLSNAIVESMQPLLDEKGHSIDVSIPPDTHVIGAQTELYSAFSNLIANAIHYTPDGGNIKVTWQQTDSSQEFSVSDDGSGIPAHHLDRLTQRFYRIDTDRSREGGGTGLGLAIVKHVMQRHNGALEISSKEGIGSTFTCVFSAPANAI